MNVPMNEQLAYEHAEDLRRAAAAYRRAPSRAARAPQPKAHLRVTLHRHPAAVGCEA
jgi:hypothetical protein